MQNTASNPDIYYKSRALRQRILLQRELALYPKSLAARRKINAERQEARERQLEIAARNEEREKKEKDYEAWENSELVYCPAYESVLNRLVTDMRFFQEFFELVSDMKDPVVVDVWKTVLGQERRPFGDVRYKPEYSQILAQNGLGKS